MRWRQHLHELNILLSVFFCRRVIKDLLDVYTVATIDFKEGDATPTTHVRYFLEDYSLQAFYTGRFYYSLIIAIEVINVA